MREKERDCEKEKEGWETSDGVAAAKKKVKPKETRATEGATVEPH